MIEYFAKKKNTNEIEKIENFKKFSWVNVSNPSEEEIKDLIKRFDLKENNLNDGIDIYENPRFEVEGKNTYIYLTVPTRKIPHQYVSSFLIIYTPDCFITISRYSLEIFEQILKSKTKTPSFSRPRNLLRVLYLISRMFEKSVAVTIKEVRKNKRELTNLKEKDIADLIEHENKLNNYISSFGSIIQTYHRILRDKEIKFPKKDEEIIEDLIIDLNETLGMCKQTLKNISNMRDYYSTRLSNRLNQTVTVLTVFTIFLSIPTIISSIYGMNINLPLQNLENIFYYLMFLSGGIIALMFLILKRVKII